MEFKGTKNEWYIGEHRQNGIQIGCSQSHYVACVYRGGADRNDDETIANAQLIATAPELLEALIRLKAMYTDLESTLYGHNLTVNNWHLNGDTAPIDNFFEDLDLDSIEKAEKVIAKALGNEIDDE